MLSLFRASKFASKSSSSSPIGISEIFYSRRDKDFSFSESITSAKLLSDFPVKFLSLLYRDTKVLYSLSLAEDSEAMLKKPVIYCFSIKSSFFSKSFFIYSRLVRFSLSKESSSSSSSLISK